jgi:predicted DNA-binding transcriptional regulator
MSRDQLIGVALMVVSGAVIAVYTWLLFFPPPGWGWVPEMLLKITAWVAVAGVFGLLGWIGYTLATTPPPKPIEEIEKEIEEELKKIEQELKKQEEGGKREGEERKEGGEGESRS